MCGEALTPRHIAAAAHLPRYAVGGEVGLCTAQGRSSGSPTQPPRLAMRAGSRILDWVQ